MTDLRFRLVVGVAEENGMMSGWRDGYFWAVLVVSAIISLESLTAAFIVFFGCLIFREVYEINERVHNRE